MTDPEQTGTDRISMHQQTKIGLVMAAFGLLVSSGVLLL